MNQVYFERAVKKMQFLLFFTVFAVSSVWGQCPTNYITYANKQYLQLGSQAAVNNFASTYANCTTINTNLIIGHFSIGASSNITDLTPLSNITHITGEVIIRQNPSLVNANLNSLQEIGGDLTLFGGSNINLTTLSLNSLTSIGGKISISNTLNLSTLGLNSLQTIGGSVTILQTGITSISLGNVTSLNASLDIRSNSQLNSISGLQNLASVNGSVTMHYNDALVSLSGLQNLTSINGTLSIRNNAALTSLAGLHNLTSGITNLRIQDNPNLEMCTLSNLCAYLSNNSTTHPRTISGNKSGSNCVSANAVIAHCSVSCSIPTALTVNDVTGNTATLSWTSSGSSFDIEWGAYGFTLGSGTAINLIGQNSHTISSLSQNTQYQFYVRQNCGYHQSNWAGPFGFKTCQSGNIVLVTQEQINNFSQQCTTINGNLIIGETASHLVNSNITDLSPLNWITHVTGDFVITRTVNLNQVTLNNLQQVGGKFQIVGTSASSLNSVSFNGLTSIGGHFQLQDPALISVSGMNNLTSIGGNFYFSDLINPTLPAFTSLASIGGNFQISGTSLTSISGFPALQSIAGNFTFGQTSAALETVSGFGSLIHLGGIEIGAASNNIPLKSFHIGGTSPITVTGNVSLQAGVSGGNSPNFLVNGLSFGNIVSVGGNITLTNPKATSISGFENLQTVNGGITITGTPNLTSINFGSLSGAMSGALSITNSPSLTAITGLSGITSVGGDFVIAPNLVNSLSLTSLSTFNNLTSVGGNFNISGTRLSEISGFNSLTTIGGFFRITSNTLLTQIPSFNNLQSIGGYFQIGAQNQLNPLLTQISGFQSLNHLGGYFDIYGNAALQTVNLSGSSIGTVNGYLRFTENGNNLSTVNLGNITAVSGNLHLQNISATTITGLNLSSIGGYLTINTTGLTSISFLSQCTSVGGLVTIQTNPALTTFLPLSNLASINGALQIEANNSLTSLDGLQNISGITNLRIRNNTNLDSCSISNLCEYLSNPPATHPRTITGNKTGGNCVNEDLIIGNCPPPCIVPTDLAVSGITVSGATLSWISQGISFDLQWGTSDFELGQGILVNNITTTSYNLSGLSYDSSYKFYVRQNCENAQTDWAGPFSFSTPTFCPPGSYTLKTQTEVNGFLTVNPGCTTITGNLVIGHNNITYGNTNITDLSPLAAITHITGNLIIRRNYNISEISFPNLTEIGGNLIIWEETGTNIISLPNLQSIGGNLSFVTLPNLTNIDGLNNLTNVGGFLELRQIRQTNPPTAANMLTLPAFSSLNSIGGDVNFTHIFGIDSYTNILPNVQNIGGILKVGTNSFINFSGFNSLTNLGGIHVQTNISPLETFQFNGTAPITVSGNVHFQFNNFPVYAINTLHLGNITSVGGNVQFNNVAAQEITGLNPTTIGGKLHFQFCGLSSVSGFSNLTSIGGNFHFQHMANLTSMAAFENLTSIAGHIYIFQLGALTSLEGLQNIDPSGITNLFLKQNGQLSTCGLPNICTYLSNPSNPRTIIANHSDCANETTVMNICVPPCYEPMGLSATTITANSAILGWDASDNFELEWGTSGFTFGTGNTVTGAGNSYNLSGLNPGSSYSFYIKKDCGINQSGWAGPFTFSTENYCIPSPFVASQSSGAYIKSFSTTAAVTDITNLNSGFSSGGYGNFIAQSLTQNAGEAVMFSMVPEAASDLLGFRIWADWNNNGVFEASEIVYTSSDAVLGTQTGWFVVPNVGEGTYRMRVIAKTNSTDISPCETMFYGEAEDYTFTVLPALPCPSPTTLSVSNIGINTTTLNWNSIANAQNYTWIVVPSGENPNTAVPSATGTVSSATASVSGLISEFTYDFFIKSSCNSNGVSNWSAPYSFTTLGSPYRFVKPMASGNGDGSSWANASDDLQKMINGNATVEVWVAAGTYKPIRPADNLDIIDQQNSDNAFVLKNNVKVYGGFSGTETTLDQRDLTQNVSILSGDFNNNGIADNDDAYHVVVISGDLGNATLDGFTITGGNATGSGNISVNSNNISRAHSGGINIVQSPIALRNLIITDNNGQYGGGIFLIESAAAIKDVHVKNNTSESGAGIKLDHSAVAFTNLVVTGNVASTFGGGIDIYGTPSPTLTNVTVSGNIAQTGGGICVNESTPSIKNTIVYGNNTGLVNLTPSYQVTYLNSLVEGVTTNANGNIDGATDPMFTDMPDFNTAPFAGGDYTLQLCSPIINKGNNTHISGSTSDISGNSRIYNGTVDLGAYEVQQGSTAPTDLYASGLHTTTVTLGWTSESDLFDIEWGVQGFTQGSGTLVSGLTVNSYTLTNLTFDTTYEFYVRERCGGNFSEWSEPFVFTPVYSICPLGYLAFTSQAQINTFGATYSTCNVTTGHLVINGSDISDLSPLMNIVEVGGNFYVHNNNVLTTFNGLHNIKKIGGYIRLVNNPLLTSISALNLVEQNGVLNSALYVENNPSLTSLDGLDGITEIKEHMRIVDNPALSDISALTGLTGVGTSTSPNLTTRYVSIQNTAISSLSIFNGVTTIYSDFNISDNPNLTSLQGLNNITSVAGYFRIHNNGVTNLDALSNLTSVNGNLTLNGSALTSATGLSNLTGHINGQLMIENTGLSTLDGLQGITSLGGRLFIGYNPNLTNIEALSGMDANSILDLVIRNNNSLSACSIESLCEYLSNDSATHPRYIVFNSGNCSNLANVIAACPSAPQCPEGNIVFSSQAQIDNFILQYPNCTELPGQVRIAGGHNITNLDGLQNIQVIHGGFLIWANHGLTSLTSPSVELNLHTIGSTITIYNNSNLTDIDELTSVTTLGGHLYVQHNHSLLNLDGFSNLVNFSSELRVENNSMLQNIDGLSGISGNILSLNIRNNDALITIEPLQNVTKIGYLYVIGNELLENLDGLSNVTQAVGSLTIHNNASLNDISGIGAINSNLIFGNAGGFNTGVGVVITNNPSLSVCNLPTNICTYLAGPKRRTISGNLTSCSNEQAAIASCQSCDVPTNPMAVSVTAFDAEFSWTDVDVVSYNWILVEDNQDPDMATPLFTGTTSETTIFVANLDSNTHYDFYVKSNCGSNTSGWSSRVDIFTEVICPTGNVFLTTQAEVNAFSATYTGCTEISGNLIIGGIYYMSDITDLSPLDVITHVGGNLSIQNIYTGLTNLNGLHSIQHVGGNVDIYNNYGLTTLTGLEGLITTSGYFTVAYNAALTSLTGLDNLSTVGNHLTIFGNHSLTNLHGLGSISSIGNYLNIAYNTGLTSLSGFGNSPVTLDGSLDVRHNTNLISLEGLSTITSVGQDLRIWDNQSLQNLDALSNITAINGYLHIEYNSVLADISGLANINPSTIGGSLGLYIVYNPLLSICNLDNFCTYLTNPSNVRTILYNGEDCTEQSVVIACTPVCDIPQNVSITSVTTDSAQFNWDNANGANGYIWVVMPSGVSPTGTPVASGTASGTTAAVVELTPTTSYDFYVKSNCNSTNSDWSQVVRFSTYSPNYQMISVSGFNSDIIAEGSLNPATTTTNNIDGWQNVFYNNTYSYNGVTPENSLPANGMFVSEKTTGLPYQLAPATQNNALRLTQGQSGTLTFDEPVSAKTVFALITSGGNFSEVTMTVQFEDNTTEQFSNNNVSDWFNGDNYAIKGVGRVERTGNYFQDLNDNPRIYEVGAELSLENQSKNITNITFQRVSNGSAVTGIMGVSIEKGIPPCSEPTDLSASNLTENSADLSWTNDGNLFDIEWGVSGFVQGSGTMASDLSTTTHNLSGLTADTEYEFYVRQDCTVNESSWVGPFLFTTLSVCDEVTDLTVSNITTDSADLSWISNGNLFDIEWGISGFVQGSGTMASDLSTTTHNLSGLTADTEYEFYVRQDCTVNESAWAGPFTFTTLEEELSQFSPITLTGFNHDVIAEGSQIPTTTTTIGIDGGDSGYVFINGTYSYNGVSPTRYLPSDGYFISEQTPDLPYQLAPANQNNTLRLTYSQSGTLTFATPAVAKSLYVLATSGGGSAQLSITVNFDDSTSQQFTGIQVNDWWNASNYALKGIGRITRYGYGLEMNLETIRLYEAEFTLSEVNQEKYIESIGFQNEGWGIANIMGISIENGIIPTCPKPTALTSSNVTANSVDFVWDTSANSNGYEWIVVADGADPNNATPVYFGNTTQTEVSISGLDQNTAYDFYLKSDCGSIDGYSNWVKADFTTLELCPTPTDLTVSNLTMESATLSWTSTGALFEIEWGVVGFSQGSGVVDTVANQTNYNLSGLDAGITYDFYVRQDCSSLSEGFSTWVKHTFTANDYCQPTPIFNSGVYGININSFTTSGGVANINNTNSGFSNNGFGNFSTTHSVSQYQGESVAFSAVPGGLANANGLRIWVDWNKDGIFANDASEVLYVSPSIISGIHNGSFEIPTTQQQGDYRMRVTIIFNANFIDSCGTGFYGETEDYTLTVLQTTCPKPTALTSSNVTANSVDFVWDASANSNGYEWIVVADGADPNNATPVYFGNITQTEVSISGLNQNTAYDFYVKSDCGSTDGHSIWVKTDFTTLELCPTPTDLTVSNLTIESATLSWTSFGDLFDIEFGSNGFIPTGIPSISGITNPYILTVPTAGSYQYYVRQNCNNDGTSSWVGPYNFVIGAYQGDIPTKYNTTSNVSSTDYCTPDPIITIEVPQGMQITGLKVYYNMTALNGAWMSEQRSFIYSPTLGIGESSLANGVGNSEGTFNYNRTMDFANGATGVIDFTLRAWRTWGGSGCGTNYNYVNSGTWVITPTFEPIPNCPASTIWTGVSWSNGEPNDSKKAIIDGALYLSTDLTACELEVTANGSLTIPSNRSFTVKGKVINNSNATDFKIASNGILLQIDDVENQGAIRVERESSPMYRLDYTIWSSPVSGMLLRDLSEVSPSGGSGTLWNRVYTLGDNAWNQVWASQQIFEADYTTTFDKAKGYMYRAKNNWVTRDSGNPGESDLGVFTGVPNNGTISINTPLAFNAVGNPYPSPIDGDDLLGSGITALYFWTNANTPDASGNYQLNNWAYYTQVGGTGVQIGGVGDPIQVPNGIIQPGQGFVIGTTVDVNQITFTNEMRMGNNGMFFRQMSNERHRFWLNLSDEMAVYNQILVGYMENATQGVDEGMDAIMFAYEGNAIYSLIDNNEEQYVVQGRALPFTDTDVVKLGFRAIQSGNFSISLNNFDGIFEEENLIIYLKDNYNQTQHNLKDGAYSFVSEEGMFENRFEVVYQTTMSTDNPVSTDANWIVYRQDKGFQVQTIGFEMKEVSVYDMLGRNVYTSQAEGTNHKIPNLGAEGVFIVKVTTSEDKVLNKKVR